MSSYIHETAIIDENCKIGDGSKIWHFVHIRDNASIGKECIVGKSVYIDSGVKIGNRVKIGGNSSIYRKCEMDDGVLIGPHVILLNDKYPRAVNIDGRLKTDEDWKIGKIVVKRGASIGAGSIVLPDITIGSWSIVGAGSIVVKNVPNHGLVYGNPAKLSGFVCKCGKQLLLDKKEEKNVLMVCSICKNKVKIPIGVYNSLE